jgi:hypothetical protein
VEGEVSACVDGAESVKGESRIIGCAGVRESKKWGGDEKRREEEEEEGVVFREAWEMAMAILLMGKFQTVLFNGLADGRGKFDDSLAGCRKHTDASGASSRGSACVELLASARRGSERAARGSERVRGLTTALLSRFNSSSQRNRPGGARRVATPAGHSYRQGAYDHPAGREITQRYGRSLSGTGGFCRTEPDRTLGRGSGTRLLGRWARFARTDWRASSIVGGKGKF